MGRWVEVWAADSALGSGQCGSGWVVGARGVLTSAHVIADAPVIQIRVAEAPSPAAWVDAQVCWKHPTLDVALLEITPGEDQHWEEPGDPSQRLAEIGAYATFGEAIGFPDATVRPDGLGTPENVPGTLLPAGAGRAPARLIPFDVDVSVPDDAALWKGISGSAVHDEYDRLVAIVVKARPDRQGRRLLVLPLGAAVHDDDFERAAALVGLNPVVEHRHAPIWRSTVLARSRAPAGTPLLVGQVSDLAVFGVHAAVVADTGSTPYGAYVKRDKDGAVSDALAEAIAGGRRIVLIVGDSAAGKSRCGAEAIRDNGKLATRKLVVPRFDTGLTRLIDAGTDLDRTVLWLDDVDRYFAHGLDPDVVGRLADETAGIVIVATIRRSQLLDRQASLADPVWELLTDEQRVHRVELNAAFSESEFARAQTELNNPSLLAALERGVGIGEYLVGGRELVKRLQLGTGFNRHLTDTIVSWYRTGLSQAISESELRRLWMETFPSQLAAMFRARTPADQAHYFREACAWACQSIISRDAHDVALVSAGRDGYEASDYVVDHVSRQPDRPTIAQAVWDAALAVASSTPDRVERLWRVGTAANREREKANALSAMRVLADLGDVTAGLNVAILLSELGRSGKAVVLFDEILARLGHETEPEPRYVAVALVSKGVNLGKLGRVADELAAYDEVVARFGDSAGTAVREQVAKALFNKGLRLGKLGRLEDAVGVYDELMVRLGDATDPALREPGVRALVNKGASLGELGRSDDELDAYGEVVARFGEATEPIVREAVADALLLKGGRLGKLGRLDDAVGVYDELMVRFSDATEPALRAPVVTALVNKGAALGKLGRAEDEFDVYDEIVSRFGQATEPAVREAVALALFNKAAKLGSLGRFEDSVGVYGDVVVRFGEAVELALREQVAKSLVNGGFNLGLLGRSKEQLAMYDEVVARFGDATETALREQVAMALFNKGAKLSKLGRSEDELDVYDEIVARFGDATVTALREQAAIALFNKAARLGSLGRLADAVGVYDELVARFCDASEQSVREQVGRALVNKAAELGELGRSEDELGVYDEVVERFADATEHSLRKHAAIALVRKAAALRRLGRSNDAVGVYDEVLTRFGNATEPTLRKVAEMAREARTIEPPPT